MKVSRIGFGAMGLTAFYGKTVVPEEEALKILRKAFDLGVRHFDTAQVYRREDENGNMNYNEELIGKFLRQLTSSEREDVTVATKFSPIGANGFDPFNEQLFVEETKNSLARLGVESIDLYYFHRTYPKSVSHVSEWMGAAKKLVEQGIIKRIGLSEANADIIREAHSISPICCVQQEWSLFARDSEASVVPTCKELGIGIVCYSPIGRGFLAGRFATKEERPKDWRSNIPYLYESNIEENLKILKQLEDIAKGKSCTTGQLCLAWLIAQGGVPIPGTTNIRHLEDNMGALDVKLSSEEIENLGRLGSKVVGNRGDESYMSIAHNSL